MSGIWVARRTCPECGLRFRVPNGPLCLRCSERIAAGLKAREMQTAPGIRDGAGAPA